MDEHDLRVLAVLTTWLGIHRRYVNVDRLLRCVSESSSMRVRAYWAVLAQRFEKDRRYGRLAKLHEGTSVDLLATGTDFQLERRGADPRFVDSPLRVPAGVLRDREADVLSPVVLIGRHTNYRNRVLMGPSWRADVWTVLESDPSLGAAEAARRAKCSFATAWQVVQDLRLFQASEPTNPANQGSRGRSLGKER